MSGLYPFPYLSRSMFPVAWPNNSFMKWGSIPFCFRWSVTECRKLWKFFLSVFKPSEGKYFWFHHLETFPIIVGGRTTPRGLDWPNRGEERRSKERMMSICLTWFPISGLGKPKLYQNMWCFTRIVGSFQKYSLVILDVSETLF